MFFEKILENPVYQYVVEEFHPSKLPVCRTFEVNDEKEAHETADEIVKMGFKDRREAFKVLMPKETKLAKRIGYTLTTSINAGLRSTGQHRGIRYWTYHHDKLHYAIILINADVVEGIE